MSSLHAEAIRPTAALVSLFAGSTHPEPVHVWTVGQVLDAIQHGTYQRPVQRLRELLRTQGKDAYDVAKKRLHGATFCGTFSPTRAKAHLHQHSGIVHGDLDHIEDVEAVKQRLCADPFTVYCFVSPSATGLKVGMHVDPAPDDGAYKHAWQAVADYHKHQYEIIWDPSGKDISRLCYLSHDPDLYRNPEAQRFPVPDPVPRPAPRPTASRTTFDVPRDRREWYARQAIQTAVAMIDMSTPGHRHHARLRASELLGGYIAGHILTETEAYQALKEAVDRTSEHPERSMKTIAAGLQHGQKRPITLEELEAERRAWLTAPGDGEDHTATAVGHLAPAGTANGSAPFRTTAARTSPRLRTISTQEVRPWL